MRTLLATMLAMLVLTSAAPAAEPTAPTLNVDQSVVKLKLTPNVSLDDAVEAMKTRANKLNFKMVGELPLSKQLAAMGQKTGRIEIFQFCDPLAAKRMIDADIDFAAYLPCRIALVQDKHGQGWLVMMNLDMLIQGNRLSPSLKRDAIKVRDTLMEIMKAGAQGDWG